MDNVEPFEHVKASLSNVAESLEMYSQETHVIDPQQKICVGHGGARL